MYLSEFTFGPFAVDYPAQMVALVLGLILVLAIFWYGPPVVPWLVRSWWVDELSKRSNQIVQVHTQADRSLAEADSIRSDYAARLQAIEQEHRARIDAAVRDAESARADIIADAQSAAQTLMRRSQEEVARERMRQHVLLRRQVVQATLDAAEGAVSQLNTESTQRQLIAEFIGQIGAGAQRAEKNGAASGARATVAERGS